MEDRHQPANAAKICTDRTRQLVPTPFLSQNFWLLVDTAPRTTLVQDDLVSLRPPPSAHSLGSRVVVKMLVLYETALGYCLFKVTDSGKLDSEKLWEEFETPESANKL